MSDYSIIPESTIEGLKRFAEHGVPTGGFLEAVLSNNLMESFARADLYNRAAMFEICSYVYNEMPYNCYGSPEIYREWIKSKMEVSK